MNFITNSWYCEWCLNFEDAWLHSIGVLGKKSFLQISWVTQYSAFNYLSFVDF